MSAQIDYAPNPRRRVPWRWVGLIMFLIAAGVLVAYRTPLTAQTKLRWTLGQCRTYTRPADSIALEANAAQANQLAAKDSNYRLYPPGMSVPWGPSGGAYRPVDPWDALPATARPAPLSMRFPYYLANAPVPVAVPLFVHQLSCKDRPARLVAVELNPDGLYAYVIAPGRLWETPTLIWQGPVRNLGENIYETLARAPRFNGPFGIRPGETAQTAVNRALLEASATQPPARIYFGQPHLTDPAKFIIRVAIAKSEFNFEGQLMPNDTVQIEGPLLSEVFKKLRDDQ
jgi:hypothetical protein